MRTLSKLSPTHTSINNFDIEDKASVAPEQEHTSYTDQAAASDIPDALPARSEEDAHKSDPAAPLNENDWGIYLV